jgi:hypothetical protein
MRPSNPHQSYMKRKLIQTLLQLEAVEVAERAADLFPGDDPAAAAARLVLTEAIAKSREASLADPGRVYAAICSSTTGQLVAFLKDGKAAKTDKKVLAQAQVLLTNALTSKAGRKKTSDLSRQEQLAAAAARHREKVKGEKRKRLDVWISPEAAAYLEAIQTIHSCESQADAVELVLDAAMKGQILQPTP